MGGYAGALVISTLFALAGGVLIAIAFGTNNWREINVTDDSATCPDNQAAQCVDRIYGMFRLCYPKGGNTPRSSSIALYKDPLGYNCSGSLDYSIQTVDSMSKSQKEYIHLMRTYFAFYIVALSLAAIAVLFIIAGCGKRSSKLLVASGIFCFFSAAFIAASIGVWHRVQELQDDVYQPSQCNASAQSNTVFCQPFYTVGSTDSKGKYGWSYIIAWIGCGCLLIASVLLCCSAGLISRKKRHDEVTETTRAYYAATMGPGATTAYSENSKGLAVVPYGSAGGAAGYHNYGYGSYGGHHNAYAAYGYGGYNPYSAYYAPYYMHYYQGTAQTK